MLYVVSLNRIIHDHFVGHAILLTGPVTSKPVPKLDYEDVFKQSSETNTTVYCGNLPNEALTEGE